MYDWQPRQIAAFSELVKYCVKCVLALKYPHVNYVCVCHCSTQIHMSKFLCGMEQSDSRRKRRPLNEKRWILTLTNPSRLKCHLSRFRYWWRRWCWWCVTLWFQFCGCGHYFLFSFFVTFMSLACMVVNWFDLLCYLLWVCGAVWANMSCIVIFSYWIHCYFFACSDFTLGLSQKKRVLRINVTLLS